MFITKKEREKMIYTEHDYFKIGYAFEKNCAIAHTIRAMLDKEKPHDQTEARHLIEQGRSEARQS